MNYEQLLTAADQEGLLVKEQPLTEHDGLIRGSHIAIRKDIETQAEKSWDAISLSRMFLVKSVLNVGKNT